LNTTRQETISPALVLKSLKETGEAPDWLTVEGYTVMSKGYLLKGETPRSAWRRVVSGGVNDHIGSEKAERIFNYLWNGWLGLASPVFSNLNTTRGLPISCYSLHVEDSISGILDATSELAVLAKHGGGVGVYWGDVRARGSLIQNGANGTSEGVIPFMHMQDATTLAVSQGSSRKGASAAYLPIEHGDASEFIRMRRPLGDVNRQNLNIHHGVTITDDFMRSLKDPSHPKCKHNRELWKDLLTTRLETGEPYIMFYDNVNKNLPECYKSRNLNVSTSNLCSEILLHTDNDHSFVCCLSSVNLEKYDEWKDDKDFIGDCVWFLDAVMEDFITKAKNIKGFERAVRFAENSRALGLGVLGWHSLLQKRSLPFDSFQSMMLNTEIFRRIQSDAVNASKELALQKGAPLWCSGLKEPVRNSHLIALAPTATNSVISGGVSPGIEPIVANAYLQKTAKGTFIKRNEALVPVLEKYNQNTEEVWKGITANNGSVAHLSFLTDHEKEVYKTAYEINQVSIVKQAASRQKYIDQGQSLNIFVPCTVNPKDFHDLHYLAWESGIRTLYYSRSTSITGAAMKSNINKDECKACEG
jgi:ribonucleoside-diphosphate reductase alpha chain